MGTREVVGYAAVAGGSVCYRTTSKCVGTTDSLGYKLDVFAGLHHHDQASDPQYKFLPSTRARILRSATERSTIQKPQSGCTHLMRSAPRTLTACSMRRAIWAGVSASLSLMSITPTPRAIDGFRSRKTSSSS